MGLNIWYQPALILSSLHCCMTRQASRKAMDTRLSDLETTIEDLRSELKAEIKASQELAAEVVSRIYRSIFDFAFERGSRTSKPIITPITK